MMNRQSRSMSLFMSAFKGFKIVSTDPLVVDYYSDTVLTDAELLYAPVWPNPQNFGEGCLARNGNRQRS